MIENIFLMSWNPALENPPDRLATEAAYPDENDHFNTANIREKIFRAHRSMLEKPLEPQDITDDYLRGNMKALTIDEANVLCFVLPYNNILGLVFSKKENPYDYRNEIIRLMFEYFLAKFVEKSKEKTRKTLLLTLFVDLRKYSDEVMTHQEEQNRVMMMGNTPMIKLFVFGLDNAGKSSLMRLLATGKYDSNYFPPTKKFRITNINLPGFKLVAWDMPGQKIFRSDWLRGAQASNILLYVLDLADPTRFEEAYQELYNMLDLFELQGIPLLFLANKNDVPNAVHDEQQIIARFGLTSQGQRDIKVVFGSVAQNSGISDAVEWIRQKVDKILISQGTQLATKTNV